MSARGPYAWATTRKRCEVCRKNFDARKGQRFCSTRCRDKFNNEAKRNGRSARAPGVTCAACGGNGSFGKGWRRTMCKKCKGKGKVAA